MTTRPAHSEQNPTAELRDWNYIDGRRYVHGRFYYHPIFDDGAWGTVMNIKDIRTYKDHIIVVTEGGEYYKAYFVERHLNGGSK